MTQLYPFLEAVVINLLSLQIIGGRFNPLLLQSFEWSFKQTSYL